MKSPAAFVVYAFLAGAYFAWALCHRHEMHPPIRRGNGGLAGFLLAFGLIVALLMLGASR